MCNTIIGNVLLNSVKEEKRIEESEKFGDFFDTSGRSMSVYKGSSGNHCVVAPAGAGVSRIVLWIVDEVGS